MHGKLVKCQSSQTQAQIASLQELSETTLHFLFGVKWCVRWSGRLFVAVQVPVLSCCHLRASSYYQCRNTCNLQQKKKKLEGGFYIDSWVHWHSLVPFCSRIQVPTSFFYTKEIAK